MPARNEFCHQNYPTAPVIEPVFQKLTVVTPQAEQFAELHTKLNVRRVLIVHGTFLGNDPLGLCDVIREIGRSVPIAASVMNALASTIEARTKAFASSLPPELGNYSEEFRSLFQSLTGPDPQIDLVSWSSQNHHLARADLAVQLAHRLFQISPDEHQRILLWGHSHAGNAFALLSNLLANQKEFVAQFFDAVRGQPEPHWSSVRDTLLRSPSPHPIARRLLITAFGTPVRYGWDTSGYEQLVHVLHHREYPSENPIRTEPLYPPHKLQDILNARYGDWVQAFALAGTDVSTPVAVAANDALDRLLSRGLNPPETSVELKLIRSARIQNLCGWWKSGTRCHQDGTNFLIEYEPSGRLTPLGNPIENSLLGHGVATSLHWLPAHIQLVAAHLLDCLHGIRHE